MPSITDVIIQGNKAYKDYKTATGNPTNKGDGKIGLSVSVPNVPGTSIYTDIDTKDIEASRVGIKGGEGGNESISIGREGIKAESSTSLGIGGSSVSINVGPGGDVSASANTGIGTPFGDFSINVDVVKDGCTISVSRGFNSPIKSFTSTETYTAPGCKPPATPGIPTPSPTPTPGSPNTPGGPIDPSRLPPGCSMTVAAIDADQVDACKWAFGRGAGTYDDNDGYGPYTIDAETSELLFGEEGGGYYYMNSTGIYYQSGARFNTTGSVFCGSKNETAQCSSPSPSPSPSPTWNPPPMPEDKCCKETASMLRKIMKVLAVDEIEKNGIKIPKEFLAPGGTGQLKVSNYAELQLNLFRTVNRYGIDTPIVVEIKDVNKAKKGDQSAEVQFNSPAAAIQALVELAIENKGDAATRLQIQVRLIYAVTRTLKMVAGIGETIREVVKMLGSPFRWTTIRLPLEFDLTAGKTKSGKGFGDKQPAKESEDGLAPGLEANDEDTTESMLPEILTTSDYPLPVPRFVETEDDLQDLLMKAILLLGSRK